MTIKQQGGIFGRNPAFNDVDASNVTTGGLTSETLTVDSTNPLVNITDRISGTPYTSSLVQSGSHLYIDNKASGALRFRTGSSEERLYIAAGGDVTVSTGNLIIGTSGKGIDFSATAGTGTSELFDDYEEGTWTPQLYDSSSTGGNASPTSGTGFYTKVGNTVTVWCSFINISTSGMTAGNTLWVHGFPYSTGTAEGIGAVNCDTLNFGAGKTNVVVLMYPSNALALLKQTGDNVSDANTIVSDITSGTTDIVFTVTYKV